MIKREITKDMVETQIEKFKLICNYNKSINYKSHQL